MNKAGFLVLGAVMAMGSALLTGTGCGSSSSGAGGAGGSGSGGAATSTSVSTSVSTSTSASTSTSTSSGSSLASCSDYCTSVMANCKDAAVAQYNDMDSCMNSCASFPKGMASDTSGDTLGCRAYHATNAAGAGAAVHCTHAGPTGGDQDVTDTMPGTCGEGCEAFCNLATTVCKTVYDDKATCMTECKTFKKSADSYSTADTDKDDFGCRMYHLTFAATSAMAAMTHCEHIKPVSATCTK